MIKFITYKSSGEIVGSGVCPEGMLSLQGNPSAGVFVLPSDADWVGNYLEEGQVVPMPPQPCPHHIFDYGSKAWIDPRALEDLKAAKWSEIKLVRDTAEFGGFVWDGSRFDSDAISQSRIQGAVQLAAMASGFSLDWTLANNSVRTLKAADMAEVGAALGAHVAILHAAARDLRAQINAATSAEQIANINWPEPIV